MLMVDLSKWQNFSFLFFSLMNDLFKLWEDIAWVMWGLCGKKIVLLTVRREINHN